MPDCPALLPPARKTLAGLPEDLSALVRSYLSVLCENPRRSDSRLIVQNPPIRRAELDTEDLHPHDDDWEPSAESVPPLFEIQYLVESPTHIKVIAIEDKRKAA